MNIIPPASDEWITPQIVKDQLMSMFNFTLDAFADEHNSMCPRFFTKEQDAFIQSWAGERVFMNPPYSRVDEACEKAFQETQSGDCPLVGGLLASRTGSDWWKKWVDGKALYKFYRGRINFTLPPELRAKLIEEGKLKCVGSASQFDSVLVLWLPPLRRK